MSDNIFMELSTHLNLQALGVQMNTNYLPNHVQQLFLSRLMPGEIWQGHAHNTPIEASREKMFWYMAIGKYQRDTEHTIRQTSSSK
jgi:hypothetical protein